jgi:hypothetical protein
MIPDVQDLTLYADDDYAHEFTWEHDGQAQPLTGLAGVCQIKRKPDSAVPLVTQPVLVVDSQGGVFRVTLTKEQTAALPIGRNTCVYDIQFDGPSGRSTPVRGKVSIKKDVTRL